jgi:hypothetical protein
MLQLLRMVFDQTNFQLSRECNFLKHVSLCWYFSSGANVNGKPFCFNCGTKQDDPRPHCCYGNTCTRKNPQHKREYQHTGPPQALPQRAAAAAGPAAASQLPHCKYGNTCTRTNPQHKLKYQHSGPPAAKASKHSGPTKILYHQTDAASAQLIMSSQHFKCGTGGLCGPGIYFAETAAETQGKAHKHGVILRARVALGRELTLGAQGNAQLTGAILQAQGYDSVKCLRPGGTEYVVYDSSRVTSIKIDHSQGVSRHVGRGQMLPAFAPQPVAFMPQQHVAFLPPELMFAGFHSPIAGPFGMGFGMG